MSNESCAARLPNHLHARIESIDAIFNQTNSENDNDVEEAYRELDEFPLSVEKIEVIKILLSTGGPGDWFEFHVDRELSYGSRIIRAEYHFQDWFDHASVVLEGDDFYTAERFCEYYLEIMA